MLILVVAFTGITTVSAQVQPKVPNKPVVKKPVRKPEPKDTLIQIQTDYGNIVLKLYKETALHRRNFLDLVSTHFYDSLLFHRVIQGFMIQGGDPESKRADTGVALGNGDIGYRIPAEINTKLFYHKRGALAAARDNNPLKESSGCQFYIVQGKKFSSEELTKIINTTNYNAKMSILNEVMARDTVKAHFDDYTLRGDDKGRNGYLMSLQTYIDKEYKKIEYMPDPMQVITYREAGGSPHLDGNYTVFGEVVSGMNVVDKIAEEPVNALSRPLRNVRMKIRFLIK